VLLLDEPTRSLDPLAAARMRATIKSLSQDESKRVTVFLTSHNLAEVEELCDRVAIISKGSIKALDAPRSLRAMHSDNERVSITFAVDDAEKVETALREAFVAHPFTLGRSDESDAWSLSFSRKANDQTLNTVLWVLHNTNCMVKTVDSERATLLEVLEHYEQPEQENEKQEKSPSL
jgi:ABC-2 type transport system ATP-binding protein